MNMMIIVVGLMVLLILSIYAVSTYMVLRLTLAPRRPIQCTPAYLDYPYENVVFPSRIDGITLRGWHLLPNSNGSFFGGKRAIIVAHGKDYHRANPIIKMMPLEVELARQGYHVLAFDFRGCGESDGKRFSLGYYERRDLLGAVDYLKSQGFTPDSIGVLGFSTGAATALISAAESSDIAAVVSDSSFSDLRLLLNEALPKFSGLPAFLNKPCYQMFQFLLGIFVDEISPQKVIAKISPRPILLIHSKADQTVPINHAYHIYENVDERHTELWLVDDAEHVAIYANMPNEYINRVASFFDQALANTEKTFFR